MSDMFMILANLAQEMMNLNYLLTIMCSVSLVRMMHSECILMINKSSRVQVILTLYIEFTNKKTPEYSFIFTRILIKVIYY